MLILASNSPRRKKLLEDAGISFKVVSRDTDETVNEKMKPEDYVIHLATKKAKEVFDENPSDVVIAADTVVVYNGDILGKPILEDKAFEMLKAISGERHEVYTGVCIMSKEKITTFCSVSEVWMKEYSEIQIWEYIKTGEPLDKAGAYAIQGLGEQLVDHFSGDFFTIVGLPLKQLLLELKSFETV